MNIDIEAERKAFERWMVEDHKFIVDWEGKDPYTFGHTRDCWTVWQARAALAAPQYGHCELYGGCVCGGDTKRVREGCANWRKGKSIEPPPAAQVLSDEEILNSFLETLDGPRGCSHADILVAGRVLLARVRP